MFAKGRQVFAARNRAVARVCSTSIYTYFGQLAIVVGALVLLIGMANAQFVNGDFSDPLDGPFDGAGWDWYENDIDTCDPGAACDLHDTLDTCTPTDASVSVSPPMCGYIYSGGTGYCGDGGLIQTVTVPSTTPVYLHFWFRHKSDSWGGNARIIIDEGPIVDNDSNYYILADHSFPGGVGGGPTPWMERIVEVTPWAGHTVNIRAALWDKSSHWCNMGDHSNWMWVDDFFFYSPGVLPAVLFYPDTLEFDPSGCELLPFQIGARAFNYGVSGTIDSILAELILPAGLVLDDPLTHTQWLSPPYLHPDSSGDVFWDVLGDGTVSDTSVCFDIMFTYIAGDSFVMSDTVLYESDFEADNGGWVSTDTAGFQWGVPIGGPPGTHSGTQCWGTVMGGDYGGGSHNWGMTLSVDLSSLATTDRAELTFWHWYELPLTYSDTTDWSIDHVYDGGNVQASIDAGLSWFNISGGPYWVDLLSSTGWGSGMLPGWQRVECNLNMLVGHSVLLRFSFANDNTDNDYAGWYIDDVKVLAHKASAPIPYPDTTVLSGCIFIPPVLYADAGDDTTICFGETVILGGSPAAGNGLSPYSYLWSPAAGLVNSTAANPTASPDVTTQYILAVTDHAGCVAQDTVTVTVEYPEINPVWFWEETDCNDSNIVHICYTLSRCAGGISVRMSADSGATWDVPLTTLLDTDGALGDSVSPGIHCFDWTMSDDMPDSEGYGWEIEVRVGIVSVSDTTYVDSVITSAPLDSRPPEVHLVCPMETLFCFDSVTFRWSVDDMFPDASTPSSLFVHYCEGIDTITTFDTNTDWVIPPVNCLDAYAVVAVPDSFCNWGYDTCELVIFCDTTRPVGAIIRPFNGAYSSCPDEHIIVSIVDNEGVDPATIRLVVEGDTFSVADSEIVFSNDTLYYYPNPPFIDGQVVDVSLIAADDIYGNPLRNVLSWSFTMDLSAPYITITYPRDFHLIKDLTQRVELSITDILSGVDISSLVFVLNGDTLATTALQLTASGNGYELIFAPSAYGIEFISGDTAYFELIVTDTTDYCADNVLDTAFALDFEPTTYCSRYPDPVTPNGDNVNDVVLFNYPFMFSQRAHLEIYNRRRELLYDGDLGPVTLWSNLDALVWKCVDNGGRTLGSGLYIYIIRGDGGEVLCSGTVSIVR